MFGGQVPTRNVIISGQKLSIYKSTKAPVPVHVPAGECSGVDLVTQS